MSISSVASPTLAAAPRVAPPSAPTSAPVNDHDADDLPGATAAAPAAKAPAAPGTGLSVDKLA
jgi:hypothetical protein